MADTTAKVLSTWGDTDLGAMNGAVGLGLANLLVAIISAQPNVASICDLGCGTGYLASRLGALGFRVTGVDASDRLLKIANEHYRSERVDFTKAVFGESGLETLDLAGKFDLVVSSDVIEHLFNPKSLLDMAAMVAKPGGRLVLGTPYHGYAKNLAIGVLNKWDEHHGVHWDGGHIKFFSIRTLRQMVERGGFTVDGFRFYGRVPLFRKNMICLAHKSGG